MKIKKRIMKVGLATAGLTLLFSYAYVFASFNDVSLTHTNKDAIEFVQSQGIVQGYEDGTYKPDKTINRAEFTKIVVEAQFDKREIDGCTTSAFSDVPTSQWFAKYVCLAQSKGIIAGYPNGTFGPANNIKFTEAAKIIASTFFGTTVSDGPWYKSFTDELANVRSIPTSISSFAQEITRGEMAEIIYRLIAGIGGKASHTYASLEGTESPIAAHDTTLTGSSQADETSATNEGVDCHTDWPNNGFCGEILSGNQQQIGGMTASYVDFNEADYELALESDKIVLLYFYANWCPLCRVEVIELNSAFNDMIVTDDLVAFQVNYNDDQTDKLEEELARDHGVKYQHTKIFIQNRETLLNAKETWNATDFVDKIYELLNAQPTPEPEAGVEEYDVIAQQFSFVPGNFLVESR